MTEKEYQNKVMYLRLRVIEAILELELFRQEKPISYNGSF